MSKKVTMVARPGGTAPLLLLALLAAAGVRHGLCAESPAPAPSTAPGPAPVAATAVSSAEVSAWKSESSCQMLSGQDCRTILQAKGRLSDEASADTPWKKHFFASQHYALCVVHTRNPSLAAAAFPEAAALKSVSTAGVTGPAKSDLHSYAASAAQGIKAASDAATGTLNDKKESLTNSPDPKGSWKDELKAQCLAQVDATDKSIAESYRQAYTKIDALPGSDAEKMAAVGLFHEAMGTVTAFFKDALQGLVGLFDHILDFLNKVWGAITAVADKVAGAFNSVIGSLSGIFG